ncbi:pentapeptide repeat-containing protein [Nodularia sp. UHCC 0506]|uniref:pentapeptide repeat-containing protein n=1 Tax=Nodularia sp. UHCC 0506 TaxID=3110243 RepID=UPI002B205636|nr:pentapeptide repeat-containing protein [Nodularia sp. UHCC 0506]MEA5513982.1 pentapeptide repeat-containing protein [Nodularia sp. UHCC 0506]
MIVLKMTPEELVGHYLQGERDFRGIKLIQSPFDVEGNEIDLRGLCLQEINLSGACLNKADFTEADLSGGNLFGAVLEQACFRRAIVRDANMYSINLSWADLTEADLRGTILTHMNANCAYFDRANFGYRFEYAILAETSFRDALIPKQSICGYGNLIWNTTMPDGTVERGPYWGDF